MHTRLDNLLAHILCVAAALLLPLLIGAMTITHSLNPTYPAAAYRVLPSDAHGFTESERLDLSLITLAYLRHPAPPPTAIRLLSRQRLPGGDQPLFNERELGHLVDVKTLTDAIRIGGMRAAAALAVIFTWLLSRATTRPHAFRVLQWSGSIIAVLVAALLLVISLGWPFFFIGLHQILFPPNSWTFAGTDTLIRLFPNAFWYGYGQSLVVTLCGAALLLHALGKGLARYSARQPEI
ncbi:MAG: DUF1461 domain-containing protein [Pseudomonadales bacterium]|nr:DUF1461 domain-containing protein [Pseudomonadales bacterium]